MASRLGLQTRYNGRLGLLTCILCASISAFLVVVYRQDISSLNILWPSSISSSDTSAPHGLRNASEHLWSYIPGLDQSMDKSVDGWAWISHNLPEGYRRPSWHALREQGPKASVRTNLIEGRKYLTTTTQSGASNQFMEISNLIALSIKTNRTPIIPAMFPDWSHIPHDEKFISFTHVYDLSPLIAQYDLPIVDILELKIGESGHMHPRFQSVLYDGEHPQSGVGLFGRKRPLIEGEMIKAEKPEKDVLKCWNAYLTLVDDPGGQISSIEPVDIEWTPLPTRVYASIPSPTPWDVSLSRTADVLNSFSRPGDTLPPDSISRLEELDRAPSSMQPENQITCVDRTYFLHSDPEHYDVLDNWRDGVGVWKEVGKYIRFQPALERIAMDLLRFLMGLKWDEEVPPYLAVHIRRTDFPGAFRQVPQRQWAHEAWTMLQQMKEQRGTDIRHVVFTSDETDESWLDELRKLGWTHVDHTKSKTDEQLGWWFPSTIDSVILSSAKVFLGVRISTMSLLPYRRVLDWNGGIGGFVHDPGNYSIPDDWEWPLEHAHSPI